MVHSTKSIQNWLVTEISKWKHIERILTSKYISNGNLWLPLSRWYQDTEETEALAIRKDLEIVASCSLSQPVHWIFHSISKFSKKLIRVLMVICQGMEILQPTVMCSVSSIIKLTHSDAECYAIFDREDQYCMFWLAIKHCKW